jgi:hydroxymethylbilane synthase
VTEGDVKLEQSLAELAKASPGLFTKELEAWLLSGACDAAVHSLKDVPTQLPEGLALAAISKVRETQRALHAAHVHPRSEKTLGTCSSCLRRTRVLESVP